MTHEMAMKIARAISALIDAHEYTDRADKVVRVDVAETDLATVLHEASLTYGKIG